MSPLMTRITQQRRVNARNWELLSILFSVLGLVIVMLPRSWYADTFTPTISALISFLLAALCFAISSVWSES